MTLFIGRVNSCGELRMAEGDMRVSSEPLAATLTDEERNGEDA
jgi:hypothetical protein